MKNIFVQIKNGFTLAEVLITLVIIGVIAAMTIPTVINNTKDHEISAKVKKCYSTLSNAYLRSKADNGDLLLDNVTETSIYQWFEKYVRPYIITTKICYDSAGCWNSGDTKFLKGGNCYYNQTGMGVGIHIITAVLSDGTFINIDAYGRSDVSNYFKVQVDTGGMIIVILFDINGDKGPNTFGKDIFALLYTDNGIIPSYRDATGTQINSDCSSSGTGYSCIMKYLQNKQ